MARLRVLTGFALMFRARMRGHGALCCRRSVRCHRHRFERELRSHQLAEKQGDEEHTFTDGGTHRASVPYPCEFAIPI